MFDIELIYVELCLFMLSITYQCIIVSGPGYWRSGNLGVDKEVLTNWLNTKSSWHDEPGEVMAVYVGKALRKH